MYGIISILILVILCSSCMSYSDLLLLHLEGPNSVFPHVGIEPETSHTGDSSLHMSFHHRYVSKEMVPIVKYTCTRFPFSVSKKKSFLFLVKITNLWPGPTQSNLKRLEPTRVATTFLHFILNYAKEYL